jgi:hypothetical protein
MGNITSETMDPSELEVGNLIAHVEKYDTWVNDRYGYGSHKKTQHLRIFAGNKYTTIQMERYPNIYFVPEEVTKHTEAGVYIKGVLVKGKESSECVVYFANWCKEPMWKKYVELA